MKKVFEAAKKYGYLVSFHTNTMDSYRIASRFLEDDLLRDMHGQTFSGGLWGGGRSYNICPKVAYQKFVEEDLQDFRNMGAKGTHYIDVMSILNPNPCYNPKHPLTRKEAGEWKAKTLSYARKMIGASGSEGSWDFCAGSLDYILYVIFNPNQPFPPLCDERIPLWYLVYHGIQSYNTDCSTVNEAVSSDPEKALRNLEFGGRPLSYFYSKFTSNNRNWMGEDDCCCAPDEELEFCVKAIAANYQKYCDVRDLQFEFIESYESSDGISKITYSNGSSLVINHTELERKVNGNTIAPRSYLRVNAF